MVGHRTARDIAAADLHGPIPRLTVTHAAQASQPNLRGYAAGGTLNRDADRGQLSRPVRIVFRRHPPSVLRHPGNCTFRCLRRGT